MLNCAFGSLRASSNELIDGPHHVVISIDDQEWVLNRPQRRGITLSPGLAPDYSDIPKGPSRHRAIIGCDFAHIFQT